MEGQSVKEVMSQKDGGFKPTEMVHGDNSPGLRGPDIKGVDIDPAGIKPTDMGEQRPSGLDCPKPGLERHKQPPDHGRPMTESPRPVLNQSPNSYRPPLPQMQNPQMRPMANHVGPNQQMRQPYPNQPRPPTGYQPGVAFPPQQPLIRGDAPRPTNPSLNSTSQSPMQRSYPPGHAFGDLSQQNRIMNPAAVRPPINHPQMHLNNPAQRLMLDNYQKNPNTQPVRPNLPNGQKMPSPNPNSINQQYYNSVRPPVSLNAGPIGDGSVRTYNTNVPDPSELKQPTPVVNPVGGPGNVPSIITAEQYRNIRPVTELHQKKQENLEMKPNPEQPKLEDSAPIVQTKPSTSGGAGVAEKKTKEEKEPGIVHANVKFFEERDTAKTPLTPKILSPARPTPPSRSATFVSGDIIKGESHGNDDYESGVDETPLICPNLRSAFAKKPLRLHGKGGKTRVQSGKSIANISCPPTPIKHKPSTARGDFTSNISRTPSKSYKSIFEISPEEELLFFLNLAKANYHSYFDRHHESRIDQNSRKKENMPTANGDVHAVKKTPTRLPAPSKRSSSAHGPSTPLKSPGIPKSLPKTPDSPVAPEPLIKKVPMNKIQVGAAPSPNLKAVRSKIGSLTNTTHKPGGGNVKIESHKVDFSKAQPRIAAKNDTYAPGGGDKKIQQVKLQWSAKSKVGSLENAQHKPGGGDKKIESVKLDFKDRAKPKVGSKDNVKHVPGGGAVKIESQKLEFKAQSKVGSLDNVKHKPGGGDVKIFDDKTYLKQISCGSSEGRASGTQSYCDLSVISEVHSLSAPGTPHRGTAIKIKKSTTLGRTKPGIQKTTEVTVVSRSPSVERQDIPKSSSMHEVKLTYAKVASPKHGKSPLDNVGPIEVVNVPAQENAAILKPDDNLMEVKNLISSFEQHITSQKGLPIVQDGKSYVKTKPEQHQESRVHSQVNEEVNQKFRAVKEELDRVTQDKEEEEPADGDVPISKFIKNEIAAHEKVSEIWKEIHNINPDKPNKSEEIQPPPPPPTPSVVQRPPFQTQQLPPNMRMRAPFQQQMLPGQRPPNPQFNFQRPPQMQISQRQQFPQNQPQMRSPFIGPQTQRQPYPELGSGPYAIRPQQTPSPINPSQMANPTSSK